MSSYVPSTEEQRGEMLKTVGVSDYAGLYADIPEELLIKNGLVLPEGISELELRRKMSGIAKKNKVFTHIFRGAGAYNHFIPAIVKSVVSKEEFVTAYTPYQAEISQGILQSIFEYQTMICELTGMDVSNASVYDGATAAAEAAAMCREKNRTKMLVSAAANPDVISVIKTYADAADAEIILIPEKDGKTDIDAVKTLLGADIAGVYIQQPNYYGLIEDASAIGGLVHAAGAKFVMGCNPISLGLLPSPADEGADIAVGEGQPLGMPISFGGPYLGFMACRQALVRKLPGRIVGETKDHDGNRAFVLTLQAREQHIRREKASSNICSNEALCALTAAVYLSAMGGRGLEKTAELCTSKAHYIAEKLCGIKCFSIVFDGEFFNEFVTTSPVNASVLVEKLEKYDILGGLPLGEDRILWCVTELNSKEDMDFLAEKIKEAVVSCN